VGGRENREVEFEWGKERQARWMRRERKEEGERGGGR